LVLISTVTSPSEKAADAGGAQRDAQVAGDLGGERRIGVAGEYHEVGRGGSNLHGVTRRI